MAGVQEYFLSAILLGAGATAIMDLWAVLRKRLRGVAPADYGLVGRWLAHMLEGRFRHQSISAASPIAGERVIGWTAHYLIGIAFAFVLLAIWGMDWIDRPTIGPALIVGLGSVAAPFLLMQPGMGAGVAASLTPHPSAARLRSLTTHAVFGVGLYVTASLLSLLRQ